MSGDVYAAHFNGSVSRIGHVSCSCIVLGIML